MDRGAWWATVHEVTKESSTTERLHTAQTCKTTSQLVQRNCLERERRSQNVYAFCNKNQVVRPSEDYRKLKKTRQLMLMNVGFFCSWEEATVWAL